ncbi:DUF4159 domain-containing protein [Brevirhabdus sp.]|uniref:DUF4159 domain-containing protein n=1 Tax=Brevirhabdus sp. TaxID=2004514 RepID=UPI004058AB8C
MGALSTFAFTAPWLLLGLLALPVLWLLLRAVPPAPIRRRFPGVALLLGLADDERQSDRTPWWLLLIRTLAVAAVILGFAGPVLNPQAERTGTGPVLILLDGTWADAADWTRRMDRVAALLSDAARAGRTVSIAALTDPPVAPEFQAADAWRARLASFAPRPWAPEPGDWIDRAGAGFETWWLSDGLARDSRADILAKLEEKGPVTVMEGGRNTIALPPAVFEGGRIVLSPRRAIAGAARAVDIAGYGPDPAGVERALTEARARFDAGAHEASATLILPPELRNRITRFQIVGRRSAGAVSLTDDALRRREVAMISGSDEREALQLLSPLHYLTQALTPSADLIEGTLGDILLANPDVIILADVATIPAAEAAPLADWIEAGGLLLRFAGPRMAASDVARGAEDPFLPVRLRAGGRVVGGAMSWGEPKALRAFDRASPFFGLSLPPEVTVSAQVMAEPDPQLPERTIASLADGTPLVTRKQMGQGQVVLFHVTANAEWSTLPLSGLFVQMLERLAVSTRPQTLDAGDLEGTTWVAQKVLDGFGETRDAGAVPGVDGARLASGALARDMPPGLYADGARSLARNVFGRDAVLAPAVWPARIPVEGLEAPQETALKAALLSAALGLLLLDILASLWIGGRLRGPRGDVAAALFLAVMAGWGAMPAPAAAQQADAPRPGDDFAIRATSEVVLAHVVTGDRQVDDVAEAGLRGLSETLFRRTSIEPAEPMAVDLETDELAFFPLLYWPITPSQPMLSAQAYAKLNRFLRTGGMILFDTRDANLGGFGSATPEGRKLQELAAGLDIPPLEQVPPDHVLTRTFYLLQDFPGRYDSRSVWVEAAPPGAVRAEGMPFRNLNDGVTPVVIGGNDWAAAWAVDAAGNSMFPVGRGYGGERQREMALRFGVNLLMHVLTGNYKSDQVHVPALLDRLGQ